MSGSSINFQAPRNVGSETMSARSLVASSLGTTSQKAFKHIVPLKPLWKRAHADQMVCFFLKVAALEAVRRLSRARCPFVWRAIQTLEVLCCPPFRWLQRWAPLRVVIKGVEKFSRPLLFLSITTALSESSDHSENSKKTSDNVNDSQIFSESPNGQTTSYVGNSSVSSSPHEIVTENWLVQVRAELQKQGITLPKRINHDMLQRFYAAANGDFSLFLSSLKKTIRWRENFNILSSQELEMWSNLVFWHDFDSMSRPCLIIRLGLACSNLMPDDRPRFAQAVVSQIEHGDLHLINGDDSKMTVLIDCEGLSPFKFPMHMMKSCSMLLQDHFPNRLGTSLVVRLPPAAHVLAHSFIQDLNPTIRQKVRVLGETYQNVLSEFLQAMPAFLGGHCTCSKCVMLSDHFQDLNVEAFKNESSGVSDEDSDYNDYLVGEHQGSGYCEHALRVAILAVLLLWVFIAFLGIYDA